MHQIQNEEELTGAVVQGVQHINHNSKLVLFLDNERYVVYCIDPKWGVSDETIELFDGLLSDEEQHEAGIITKKELEKRNQHAREERARQYRERLASNQ